MLKLARCARVRFASVQARASVASTGVRPFEEIPTIKMTLTGAVSLLVNILRRQPPDNVSVVKNIQQTYGNICRIPFGPFPAVVVLRPEDVEAVFRIDGKTPIRDGMYIWKDAMKTLGKDLTLFHRLVLCAWLERKQLHSEKSDAVHGLDWGLLSHFRIFAIIGRLGIAYGTLAPNHTYTAKVHANCLYQWIIGHAPGSSEWHSRSK